MSEENIERKSPIISKKFLEDAIEDAIISGDLEKIHKEIIKVAFIQATLQLADKALLRIIEDEAEKKMHKTFLELNQICAEMRVRGGKH